MIDVNYKGTWRCMKHEINQMRAQGGGTIVNTISNLGVFSLRPGLGAYASSKGASHVLMRVAALDYIKGGHSNQRHQP